MIFTFRKKTKSTAPAISLPELTQVTAALNSLAGGIDQDFVAISEALMAYQGRSKNLCNLSAGVLDRLGAGELSASIAEIGRIVTALEAGQHEFNRLFQERGQRLDGVLVQLKAIEGSISETESMLRALDMLGFMTRVEDARLFGSDFASLAAEVRELSRQITTSQRQIAAQAGEVGQRLKNAATKLKGLEENRRSQTATIQAGARDALGALERHYAQTSQALAGLQSASSALERDFATMVIELQINDIARQKLEHVSAALDEAGDRPEQFYGVVELQGEQLRRTAGELANALKTCETASLSVADRVAEVIAGLADLMQADQNDGRIQVSIKAIESLIAGLSANQAIQAEMDQTFLSLDQAIQAIAQHVNSIRAIGFKMQLIALNSRIKAAHLGEGGRALESISGAIYGISLAARDQTEALAGRIAALDFSPTDEGCGTRVDFKLEDTTARLLSIEAELAPTLEAIRQESAGFGEGFERIRALLSAAADLPPAIDAQRTALMANLDGLERPAASSDLSELSARYTMQSERAVHSDLATDSNAPTDDDDLGLNVELF